MIEEFKKRLGPMLDSYVQKQIFYSEMYFFYEYAKQYDIQRIVESGSYLGHSAIILARLFPKAQIITYEMRENRYLRAVENCRKYDMQNRSPLSPYQIKCRYGKLNPKEEVIDENTPVLIDGPKRKNAIKLARKCLKRKAAFVAIHDMRDYLDYLVRKFGERISDSGWPSDEQIELDKNIDHPMARDINGLYGSVMAIIRR